MGSTVSVLSASRHRSESTVNRASSERSIVPAKTITHEALPCAAIRRINTSSGTDVNSKRSVSEEDKRTMALPAGTTSSSSAAGMVE